MLPLKIELMQRADTLIFAAADTNLGRLKITLIIIGWGWSKMGKTY